MPNEEQIRRIVDERLAVILGPEASKIVTQKPFQWADGRNIQLGISTGTKFGTATTQKMAFYGLTPIVQPTAAATVGGHTGGGGTAVTHSDTFTGNAGGGAYTIGDIVRIMKLLGFFA